jgi:hypothetical protein
MPSELCCSATAWLLHLCAAAAEIASMQVQLDFATKEKVALQTILEGKVLPLADELSKGLAAIRHEAGGEDIGGTSEKLGQQVTMLQRLLAATVAAMARASSGSAAGKNGNAR